MRIAVLSFSLLCSQNLYSMERSHNALTDPLVLTTGILLIGVTHILKEKSAKHVSFADETTVFYYQNEHAKPKEEPQGNQSGEYTPNYNDPVGMRIALDRNIPLIEMETAKHFIKCILGLRQLINLQESISSRARSKEISQFTHLIFSSTKLDTALKTVENSFGSSITNGQYYNFLFYLSFNYPKPILSSTILDNMANQNDSELLATLLARDGSLLNILASFYRELAKCGSTTGVKIHELKGDLCVILNQGRKGPDGFCEKIQRIVNLLLNVPGK